MGVCEDTGRLTLDYKILKNSNFYLHISVKKIWDIMCLGSG